MSTLFDDVNKKISELFRQEIEETDSEYHPRIKDLQNILISFSKILEGQDYSIFHNTKKINHTIGILADQKVGMLRKTLDENIMTMQKVNDDLKDFSNRVVPELKKDISDIWQFVQKMQDHVMKLEKGKDLTKEEYEQERHKILEQEPKVEKATFEIPVKVEDAIAEAKERDEVRKLTKPRGLKLK